MPRYNVQNPQGEWACFSTIVDDFITDFMPREEYESRYGKINKSNIMDYHEAMETCLCTWATNKSCGNLKDIFNADYIPCNYCKFWNKETKKCEIVERQDEVKYQDEI